MQKKENSEFKLVILSLKIDFVSSRAHHGRDVG